MAISDEKEFQKQIGRIETLIREVEGFTDPNARAKTGEIIESLMGLQGAGLERIMEIVWESGEPGGAIIDAFTKDALLNSLLMLYGLHPLDLQTRVMQALDKVRPYLNSHGGNVELLSIAEREGGVVRLRLQGSCKSCPSSALTLKLAIEEAIYEACPEVTAIEAEGVEQPAPSGAVSFKGRLRDKEAEAHAQSVCESSGWEEVRGIESLSRNSIKTVDISGRSVIFCRLGETFYAYGNACPGCGKPLDNARLEATALGCAACGERYDVIRAGRGLDQPNLHLEPFPLLMEAGQVKVALPAF